MVFLKNKNKKKNDLHVYEGYRLIYGLKGKPARAMDAFGQ
jgi:hypothetical protein